MFFQTLMPFEILMQNDHEIFVRNECWVEKLNVIEYAGLEQRELF